MNNKEEQRILEEVKEQVDTNDNQQQPTIIYVERKRSKVFKVICIAIILLLGFSYWSSTYQAADVLAFLNNKYTSKQVLLEFQEDNSSEDMSEAFKNYFIDGKYKVTRVLDRSKLDSNVLQVKGKVNNNGKESELVLLFEIFSHELGDFNVYAGSLDEVELTQQEVFGIYDDIWQHMITESYKKESKKEGKKVKKDYSYESTLSTISNENCDLGGYTFDVYTSAEITPNNCLDVLKNTKVRNKRLEDGLNSVLKDVKWKIDFSDVLISNIIMEGTTEDNYKVLIEFFLDAQTKEITINKAYICEMGSDEGSEMPNGKLGEILTQSFI